MTGRSECSTAFNRSIANTARFRPLAAPHQRRYPGPRWSKAENPASLDYHELVDKTRVIVQKLRFPHTHSPRGIDNKLVEFNSREGFWRTPAVTNFLPVTLI